MTTGRYDAPLRSYTIGDWRINNNNGVWQVLDSSGKVHYSNSVQSYAESWARTTKSK